VSVIIGMDPRKRPATIEVIDEQAVVLAAGRYGTDKAGYAQMLAAARKFADRIWAVEGCNGIGRHLAHRLVHDGETVSERAAEAIRAGAGVRHRQRPQDRPGRRALRRAGRPAHT
jgi:lactam utilization protein B